MGGGRRDGAGDSWGVGVAEVDAAAEYDCCDEQADVREDSLADGGLRGVDAERQHDDDAAGAGGDGKGEGIEGLVLQFGDLRLGYGGNGCLLQFSPGWGRCPSGSGGTSRSWR